MHPRLFPKTLCLCVLLVACQDPVGLNPNDDTGDTDDTDDTDIVDPSIDCEDVEDSFCVPPESDALLFGALRAFDDPDATTIQLFLSTPDGTSETQLTPFAGTTPTSLHADAVRSPDGQTVVFVSNHGWATAGASPTTGSLYAVNADGTGLRKVTGNLEGECSEWGPRFSPDGQWLLFSRACRHDERPAWDNLEFLFRARIDGSDQERLVDVREADPAPLGFGAWSRDGLSVFAMDFRTSAVWAVLVEYDVRTGRVTDLYDPNVDGRRIDRWPSVFPDGDLLIATDGDGGARLERLDVDTGELTTLRTIDYNPFAARIDSNFTLSPDGTEVAYLHMTPAEEMVGSSDFTLTVQVSDLDGSSARDVSTPFQAIRWVTWNPAPATD